MEGKDEEVYSKSLFRTISYAQLKSELLFRRINFSPSDPYYVLTLKLRRQILQKSNGNQMLLKNLDEEISQHEENKHSVGRKYRCSVVGCPYISSNHKKYLFHLKFVHLNSKYRLKCQFGHFCSREFPSFSMLKAHVQNSHTKQPSSVEIRQRQLVEQLTSLKCSHDSCSHQSVSSIKNLKTHLYSHTDKREETQCTFCLYKTNATGSLKSHLSRKHKVQTVELLNEGIVQPSEGVLVDDRNPSDFTSRPTVHEDFFDEPVEDDDPESPDEGEDISDEETADLFVRGLAITVRIILILLKLKQILPQN